MGSKKAVLVGCNYPGSEFPLNGCVNDVFTMSLSLIERFGFSEEDIAVLIDTDEECTPPTGDNILRAMLELVRYAEPGDVLFFLFSGHGSRIPAEDDEDDETGHDECIVGSDGVMLTDDFFREIVSMVPEGCRITIISDSCHSGGLIEQAKEQIGNSFLGCPIKEQAEESTGEEEDGQEKDGLKKKSVPFSAVVDMLKQKTGREEVSRSQMTPALSEILGEQSTLRGKGFFQKLLGRTEDVCAGEPEKLEEVKAGDVCEEEAEGEVDAGEEKVEGEVEAGEEEVEGEVDAGEEEVGGEVEAGEEEVEGEVEAGEEEVEGEVDAGEEEVEGEVDAGEEEVEGEVDAGEANEVPPANGVLISGCQTHQYSADANPTDDPSDSHGALTHAILTILAETEGEISNRDLVIQVRNLLVQTGYDQEPGLYCTDELADAPFIC